MTTHYETLGVSVDAEQAEIRRAYHKAARRWHPDRYATAEPSEAAKAETEMRRVNEAWRVLREPASRRAYDRRLVGGDPSRREGIRVDDGVTRIDPRLLDPSFLAARRHAQVEEISNRSSVVLRAAPVLALLGLLAAIFVFTAYARADEPEAAAPTTFPGPSLGEGIEANDCVSVLSGQSGASLLARPCGNGADGQVLGARLPDGVCPVGTTREVLLSNGAIACLAPMF